MDGTIPLMLAAAVVCCLGWGLLLTGASDRGRRVFLPVVALYGVFLQMLTASLDVTSELGLQTVGGLFLSFLSSSGWTP